MAHTAAMHSLSSSAALRSADCCRGCAVRPIYRNRSRLLTVQPQSSMGCCAEPSPPLGMLRLPQHGLCASLL